MFALLTSSCNKEPVPIVITGTWNIDTSKTVLIVKFDELKANEYPAALNFLEKNIQKIRKSLPQPEQIIFSETNSVTFKFEEGMFIEGTYTQIDKMYFKINISIFPDGIVCGSDNRNLEIYYNRDHILGALTNILTPNDPPYSVFEELIIDQSVGTSFYSR